VGWLEALDDLAHYRMAVVAMVTGTRGPGPEALMMAVLSTIQLASPLPSLPSSSAPDHLSNVFAKSSSTSEMPAAHIDDSAQQNHLSNPFMHATDLFVLLHGMLFTNIQLDDFRGMLACFLERLEMEGEGIEECEWVMMGVINLGAVLEYGRASSIIRRMGGFGRVKDRTNLSSVSVQVVVKRATTIAEDKKNQDGC
jgi:hypothetical protein